MSGRASLMSRFIFRMTPICSSLFRSEYFSSRMLPPRPPCDALYVSRLALDKTTINLCVFLSLEGIGTCCSATSCGSCGGGHDCVPKQQKMSRVIPGRYSSLLIGSEQLNKLGLFLALSSGAMVWAIMEASED
jgi:hypothetical protein